MSTTDLLVNLLARRVLCRATLHCEATVHSRNSRGEDCALRWDSYVPRIGSTAATGSPNKLKTWWFVPSSSGRAESSAVPRIIDFGRLAPFYPILEYRTPHLFTFL